MMISTNKGIEGLCHLYLFIICSLTMFPTAVCPQKNEQLLKRLAIVRLRKIEHNK